MKKLLIFALVILAIAVTSCGGRGGTTTAVDAGTVTQSITFTGYPMNARNQTISWFAAEGYVPNQAFASAAQSPFHSGLMDMLGVTIDWIFPIAGTPSAQAINLVFASGDLPDVMFGNFQGQQERLIDEGTLRDLTPYLQRWSPAYWRLIHSNPAYVRAMKTDSQKFYGYGFFREAGGWNDTYLGPVVNKAWLDELGLPMPATISDWDRTLRAFRDRYGATMSFAWSRMTGYGTGISGAFGAYTFADFRLYIDNNNRVQLANVQPEFRTQLMKFNEWWRDGLIDQDVLSINDTMARSNALNLRTGLTVTSMGQLSNWRFDAANAGNGSNWVGLQYPRGDNGTLVMVPGGYGVGAPVAAITSNVRPERMELVMRAMDYAYTDDGHLYWNFGRQGVSWEFGPDGQVRYLPLVTQDPDGLNDAIDKHGGAAWSGNCIQATLLLYLKNTPQSIEANDLWFYPNQDVTAHWRVPPSISLTIEESTRAAELQASITTYANEMAVQFLTGQANFNTWDAYVARINQMGLAELLRIQQAAFDRYRAR